MTTPASILAVDDNAESLALIRHLLVEAGYNVRPADGGELALAAIESARPDLVLLDLRMPRIDGLEVCRRLKANPATRSIPVILLSAYAETHEWTEGLKLGAADFLLKPFRPEELLLRVGTQLELARAKEQQAQLHDLQATNVGLAQDLAALERDRAILRGDLGKADQMRRVMLSVLEDQRQAEAALRESEGRLAQAMELAHLAHWEFDAASATFTFNDRFYALYGTTVEREGGYRMSAEVYARTFPIPEEMHLVGDAIRRAMDPATTEAEWHLEHRIRRRDGALRHIHVHVAAVKDSAGRVSGIRGANQDITERIQTEDTLRRTQDRLALAQRAAGVGSWDWDLATGQLEWTPELFAMFGLDPAREPATFAAWDRVMHPDDRAPARAKVERAIKDHAPLENEYRIVHPDGSTHWIYAAGRTTYDAAGLPVRMAGICLDTTNRKAAEQALQHSEALFRRTFDEAPIGAAIVRLDQSFLQVNAALCRFLGHTTEELLTKRFSQVTHPDDIPSSVACVQQLLAGEITSFDLEKRYLRKDGGIVWGRVSVSLIRDQSGAPLHLAPIIQDITERKQAEEAAREAERFVRATIDALDAHLCVLDENGLIIATNQAWDRFAADNGGTPAKTGLGADYLLTCTAASGPATAEIARIAATFRDVLAGRTGGSCFEYSCNSPTQDRWFVCHINRFTTSGKIRLVVTHENITERERAKRELQASEQRYATTLAAVNDGLWEWNVAVGTAYFSPLYYAMLGYADDAFVANYANWRALVHPEDIERVESILRQSIETGHGFNIDLRMKSATGQWCWVCTRGNTIEQTPDGHALRMVGTLSDARQRKQAEAELQRTRAILQVAMDQSPAGIAIADAPGGELRYVNDAGLAIGGGDRASLIEHSDIGRYVASWNLRDLDGQPLATDQIPMVRALTRGETNSREFVIHRGPGDERTVLANAAPIRNEAGEIVAGVVVFLDITDLKHAERDLEQFFTLVPDMVCIASADGHFLVLNDAWERVLGYTKEELMAVPYAAFIHPEDLAATKQTSNDQQTGQAATGFVNRYRAKDGTYRWLEWSATPLKEGGILFAAARDITEHRQAEAAIRESEVRYRTLADSGQALIWTAGLDKKCNYFNQPWLDFTGRRLEQELGDGWTEGVHPEDFDRCVATYVAAFDRRERFSMDYRIRHRSGEYRWIQDNGSPRFDSHGEFLGYIGHCLDITDRKQTEQALGESEERLRVTLETTEIGIWDWDVRNDRWAASPTYYSMLGYPPETGPGDRAAWVERVHPDDRAMVTERIAAVLNGSVRTYAYEARMRHADGSYRWQSVRGDVVAREPGGRPIRLVGTRIDISLRRTAEEELRQKTALLEAQLDSTLDGILVVDEQGKKLLQNRRMSELWKIPPEIAASTDDRIQVQHVMQKTRNPEQFVAQVAHLYSHPQETSRDELELLDGTVLDRYSAPVLGPDARYYGRIWTFRDITERKRADQALRESEQKHRLLIRNLHAGVVVHDADTHILLANDQASVLLGLTPDQMLGKVALDPAWCFLREDGAPLPLADYPVNRVRTSLAPMRNQVFGIRHTDTAAPTWVLVNGFPYLDGSGGLHQIVVTFVDITKLKHAESTLRETLREREALLKEIHHRVKNNLQIISSLLRLQAGQIDQPATVGVLRDMQGRIRSMALLHETLYRSGNLAQVNLADYLENVCTQLLRAHQRATSVIDLHLALAPVELDAIQAVPCGLLVNELVSNALKHAFPEGRRGEIRLSLQPMSGDLPARPGTTATPTLRLEVTDNGVGLPPGLDIKNLHSLGLQLVTDLTRQLQGTLAIDAGPGGGATFTVVFSPPADAPLPPPAP